MKATESKPNMVRLMRDIRDQLSADIQEMSLEQQKAYMLDFLTKIKQQRKKRTIK